MSIGTRRDGMGRNKAFRIPVMSIQSTMLNLITDMRLIELKIWLDKKVKKERINWGIKGTGFTMDMDLERQWYPIFVIKNRWLADAFVRHLAKYKPWTKSRRG